ncbi:hypothetical protein HanRHA438_Chr16g0762681 [Helianthus annuus]|nr:hypothetical protein HanRHA438_Chr16g0762681 [Helianthus annuus]
MATKTTTQSSFPAWIRHHLHYHHHHRRRWWWHRHHYYSPYLHHEPEAPPDTRGKNYAVPTTARCNPNDRYGYTAFV